MELIYLTDEWVGLNASLTGNYRNICGWNRVTMHNPGFERPKSAHAQHSRSATQVCR